MQCAGAAKKMKNEAGPSTRTKLTELHARIVFVNDTGEVVRVSDTYSAIRETRASGSLSSAVYELASKYNGDEVCDLCSDIFAQLIVLAMQLC